MIVEPGERCRRRCGGVGVYLQGQARVEDAGAGTAGISPRGRAVEGQGSARKGNV